MVRPDVLGLLEGVLLENLRQRVLGPLEEEVVPPQLGLGRHMQGPGEVMKRPPDARPLLELVPVLAAATLAHGLLLGGPAAQREALNTAVIARTAAALVPR